ncbi:MAG TPA: HAMP domain-containing sensor histidine kinase [Polyangiales bacterium]|nr:HAMP domain-containing sensor histidine kinase [Polyangiales bacterium]
MRRSQRRLIRRSLRPGRELRAQSDLFSQIEAALSKSPGCAVLGVVEWEHGGRVVAANDGLLALSGRTQQDLASGSVGVHQLLSARPLAMTADVECELLSLTRAPVPVRLCITSAVASNGHTRALVLGVQSQNLHPQLDALILGIVSHELRTPLGVISMATNLLLSDDISSAQRRTLQRIVSASRQSDRLVTDLLDFTAARGTGIALMRGQRDLHAIAAQALEDARASWPGREVVHERLGVAQSYLDEDRVAQVVSNLVNNALQHSSTTTKVFVQTRGESGSVALSVTNFGPPIPTELIPQLFWPLRRGESAGARRGSLGLGLYIVRHLVDAHEGTIDVVSNDRDGTRFTVRFPILPPSAA